MPPPELRRPQPMPPPEPRRPRAPLAPLALALLLLAPGGLCGDSVAAAVGRHSLGRIAELLSGPECRQLRAELSGPEDELGLLEEPEGQNPALLRRSPRRARGCSEELRWWLETEGESTPWDRLVRALHGIGRSDIARELGKDLNRDRSLELRRNARGFGRSAQRGRGAPVPRGAPLARGALPGRFPVVPRAPLGREMLFERHRPPRFGRGLLGWARPVLLGALGAFLTSVLLTGTVMYCCRWRRLLAA